MTALSVFCNFLINVLIYFFISVYLRHSQIVLGSGLYTEARKMASGLFSVDWTDEIYQPCINPTDGSEPINITFLESGDQVCEEFAKYDK